MIKGPLKHRDILIIKPGAMSDLLQIAPELRAFRGKFPGGGFPCWSAIHLRLTLSGIIFALRSLKRAAWFSWKRCVDETVSVYRGDLAKGWHKEQKTRRNVREQVLYYQLYYLWKLVRNAGFNKQLALEKIERYYVKRRSFLNIPLYKFYNPFFKLARQRVRSRFQQPRHSA